MGSINWFARNPVAANLIMVLIIGGGLVSLFGGSIVQEVFPDFAIGLIIVQVPYPGAAPEEVEKAICLRVEEAVQGLSGIKKLTARARENYGVVTVHVIGLEQMLVDSVGRRAVTQACDPGRGSGRPIRKSRWLLAVLV